MSSPKSLSIRHSATTKSTASAAGSVTARTGTTTPRPAAAWGGGLVLPFTKDLDFQAGVLAGSGIGRYGSTQMPDATLKPDGTLAAVKEYDAMVGLNYRPTTTWTVYAYAGTEHADAKAYSAVVGGSTLGYGYGSALYDNSGCLIEGSSVCAANTRSVEQGTLGAWWKYYAGNARQSAVRLSGLVHEAQDFRRCRRRPGDEPYGRHAFVPVLPLPALSF